MDTGDDEGGWSRSVKSLKRDKAEFHPFVAGKYKSLRSEIACP